MSSRSLEDRVIKKTLPNGLTVLLVEDHASPIVAVNTWFGVGSVHESEEINGLAHFQEHMVFKGTKKYGVGEIANIVKSAGGNLNAGTSFSYTMYYIVLPSRSFQTALDVQSDAMMNSTFDPDEFTKERLVVIDEARMYDDRPESFTFYRTMELGFEKHTYRRPIAGYQPIVEEITRDQLVEFYDNYYRPGNAVLVVVGDVDPADALRRIEDTYGVWTPGATAVNEPPVEPAQAAFRHKGYAGNMDHGYMGAGFHVPSILHEDYPALEMMSELLSSGRSSRLYRSVVEEKQLATSASASLLAEKWPGFFLAMASMPPEKWDDTRAAVFEEIERFKHEPVAEDELEKARRQVERSLYRELETMEGQASNLGYYQLLGDFRLADAHRDAIRNVTPEDVIAVARRYFHPDNLSVVSYVPENGNGIHTEQVEEAMRATLSSESGVSDMHAIAPAAVTAPADTDVSAGARRHDDSGVTRLTLDNGLRVLVKTRSEVPMVSMLTTFPGGGRLETAGKSGISLVTHRALTKGTSDLTAEEIVTRIEGLGGSIDSYANYDTGGVYMSVLSEHLDDAVAVYRDVVRDPAFAEVRVEQVKARALQELTKRHDNPVQLAMDELFGRTFGAHPYAHPFLGDPDEVASISAEDCARWYRRLLSPEDMVVTFVGDVTTERAREIAASVWGDLDAAPTPRPDSLAAELPTEPGEHVLRRKDLKQSVTFVGFTAPPMLSDESVALEVLNGVLTGLGGRLFVELRDKRSLGYMTGSAFNTLFDRSLFFGYANPGADGVEEAVRVILHELDKVTKELVTEEEFERSREWLIGSQLMQLQRNGSQATSFGSLEALGFGYEAVERMPERIQAVTREAMRDVAAAVFRPEHAVIVKPACELH